MNVAELSFPHKTLSLSWLHTYVFLDVISNGKRKEMKERNEESLKQSCFELPAWSCHVLTAHLDVGHVCAGGNTISRDSDPSPGWWDVLQRQSQAAELP